MRAMKALVLLTAVVAAVAVLGGGGQSPTANAGSIAPDATTTSGPAPAAPITFYCAFDASCPEILVAGDPHATIGGSPAPFRGYGDPSLELDPDTGTLWLSYSWLDVLVSDPGPPPVIDFGVRTHLARSDDGGATFTFVRQVNDFAAIQHPDTGEDGWTQHEVSTLVREGPGAWQLLWLTYFDPFGTQERFDYYYQRSLAPSPAGLGDSAAAWAQGYGTSPSWGVAHDLSAEIPELSDCLTPTEPALLAYGGETYLATNCVVADQTGRRDDLERLVLLKQEADGYSYVGELLDYSDALDLGGTRFEQADLAVAQNGAILLIGTPIQNTQPNHQGCVALEVTDLATAQVRRDAAGDVVVLASITGEDPMLGPGLCTYDAASATGVMMVLHSQVLDPFDIEFSLRATGVHPQGIDGDSDGVADTVDNCPAVANADQDDANSDSIGDACDTSDTDGDALSDETEYFCGSAVDDGGLRPERVDGTFAGVSDDGDADVDEALPPGSEVFDCDGDGYAGATEAHVFGGLTNRDQDSCGTGGWPSDFNAATTPLDSFNRITILDLTSFLAPVRYMGTNLGTNPGDVRWDLSPGAGVFPTDINVQDLTAMIAGPSGSPPMLGGAKALGGPACPWPP